MSDAIGKHETAVELVTLYREGNASDPDNPINVERLGHAEIECLNARNVLYGIGFMAREPWFIAALLRLAIAQEWWLRNPGSAEVQAIERAIAHMRSYFNACESNDHRPPNSTSRFLTDTS